MTTPSPDVLAKALAAIEHGGQIATARSAADSDAGVARAYDLAYVARVAMRETVRLTQLERELAISVPGAAARLRVIGDAAAVCFAEAVVNGTARTMTARTGRDDR